MYDSWGDGWNGGIITLDDGAGNVLATDGLASGSAGHLQLELELHVQYMDVQILQLITMIR